MDFDDDSYDEFGNYIGPQQQHDDHILETEAIESIPQAEIDSQAIVLHEDKQYYPTALEVYGRNVETLVQMEDTMLLSEPIIKVEKPKIISITHDSFGPEYYTPEFLHLISKVPESIRNVAIVGQIHHGKTSLVDLLVKETHNVSSLFKRQKDQLKYTDTSILERQRQISLKSTPLSIILSNSKGKSFLCNLIDCPGHLDFADENAAAISLVDGIVLIVDVVEGLMLHTKRLIQYACQHAIPITLVLNKIDRLILELKLPPEDALHKLTNVLAALNNELDFYNSGNEFKYFDPCENNVLFASSIHEWIFSLSSFAQFYESTYEIKLEPGLFWNGFLFSKSSNKFISINNENKPKDCIKSFLHFILEPLYKLYSIILSEEPNDLKASLGELHIFLKPSAYLLDPKPLLIEALKHFFGLASPVFADMISNELPSPKEFTRKKVEYLYDGALDTDAVNMMNNCESKPENNLIIHVTKLYSEKDAIDFLAFGRIYSGTVSKGCKVFVLCNNSLITNDEDIREATVQNIYFSGARYFLEVDSANAGNLVLIRGLSDFIAKSATITGYSDLAKSIGNFREINHYVKANVKIALDSIRPNDLPKMLDGLKKLNQAYSILQTKVEESGEHVIFGTGELYLDCCMHDLRNVYANAEINISDPSVCFNETIDNISAIQCSSETPNKRNQFTMIVEPLEIEIRSDLENSAIDLTNSHLDSVFQCKYGWDLLESRSIWAFGPELFPSNILINSTIDFETNNQLLDLTRDSIVRGFQWATKEGPLCEEPLRGGKFKLMQVDLAAESIYRTKGQVIPTIRRVCHSAILTATPRMMEPIQLVEIQTSLSAIPIIKKLLDKRRGNIIKEIAHPGTLLYLLEAYLPTLDSFGFETDLRTHSQGQAYCQQVSDHWNMVPGNPLDSSLVVRLMEPSPLQSLAREFMMKTRRRKGLNENVSLSEYLPADICDSLKELNILNDIL